jgi:hypothetical protein
MNLRTGPQRGDVAGIIFVTGMPKTNQPKLVQRFTADEIVRAIDAVTKAGLTVHAVEITNSGSIKIETQPDKQLPSAAKTAPGNLQPESAKKSIGPRSTSRTG